MTHTSDALADHDTYAPYTNDLTAYKAIFASNTNIANAMLYSTLPSDVREAIWDAFDTIETSGMTHPAGYPPFNTPADQHAANGNISTIDLLRDEAKAGWAAHVAHCFYLEANRTFPWSILRYDDTDCAGLFDPNEHFFFWDIDGATPAKEAAVIAMSPKAVYDKAVTILSSPANARQAVSQLVYYGSGFAHSSGSTTIDGWSPGVHSINIMTPDQVDAPGTASVGNDFSTTTTSSVSRGGCHFMGRWIPVLCRGINIPAHDIHGYHGVWSVTQTGHPGITTGSAHHSSIFPSLRRRPLPDIPSKPDTNQTKGLILRHGDDPYALDNKAGSSTEEKAYRILGNWSLYEQYSVGQTFDVRGVIDRMAYLQVHSLAKEDTFESYGTNMLGLTAAHSCIAPTDLQLYHDNRSHIEAQQGIPRRTDYAATVWPVGWSTVKKNNYLNGWVPDRAANVPVGVEDGDLLVLVLVHKGVGISWTPPTGYSHVSGSPFVACGDTAMTVATKIASGEGATVSLPDVDLAGNPLCLTFMAAFRNVDQATPIDEVASLCSTHTGTGYFSTPSLSTSKTKDIPTLILAAKDSDDLGLGFSSASGRGILNPTPGWTHDANYDSPPYAISLNAAYGLLQEEHKAIPLDMYAHGTGPLDGTSFPIVSIVLNKATP